MIQVHLPSGSVLRVRGTLTLGKALSIVAGSLRCSASRLEVRKLSPLSSGPPSRLVPHSPPRGLRHCPELRGLCEADWPALLGLLREALPALAPLDATLLQLTSARELSVAVAEAAPGPPLLRVKLSTGEVLAVGTADLPGRLAAPASELKELLCCLTDIPVDMQRLLLRGRALRGDRELRAQGVTTGAQLSLDLRFPGGSVSGYLCAQPREDGRALRVWYEELADPFFDLRDKGRALAAEVLRALAAEEGGCELRASAPRPRLARRHGRQERLADAVSVWDARELLALLSVRRVYREWCPRTAAVVELLLPWLALPPAEWAGAAGVPGRTVRRLEHETSLSLRFEPRLPAGSPLRVRLAIPSVETWPSAVLGAHDLLEDLFKVCSSAAWQLSDGPAAPGASPDALVAKVGVAV